MDNNVDLDKLLKETNQIKKEHEQRLFMLFDSIPVRIDKYLSDNEWYLNISPAMRDQLLRQQGNKQSG